MPDYEGIERRIFERFLVRVPLKYLSLRSKKKSQAQIINGSANGVGLTTAERFSRGTTLEICLYLPGKRQELYARGEVVWSKMIEEDKYRIGIKLEKTDLMGFSRLLKLAKGNKANSKKPWEHYTNQEILHTLSISSK